MRREDARFFDEAVEALQHADGRDAIRRFVTVAVRQQLARPRFARLLDIEESRPEIQRALKGCRSVRPLVEAALTRDDMPRQADPARAANDLGAILRGLTDDAGERGETDVDDLERRIAAALFGSLEGMRVNDTLSNASKKSRTRVRRG